MTTVDGLDMEKVLSGMRDANNRMIAAHESESIIVLGPTRAGKSTVVCMMSGLFKMCKYNGGMEKFITADTGARKSDGLMISNKAESCTTFPVKVESTDGAFKYWDTPGFGDNKGAEQEILNAYYIKRLVDNHRSVKTAFVIASHQIQGDCKAFITGVAVALKMFDSVADFKDQLLLVVTGMDQNVSPESVRKTLQRKIVESPNLKHDRIDEVKDYCKNVIKGKCGVVIMEKPQFAPGDKEEKDIPMKPEEYEKFVRDMQTAISKSAHIFNLQRINIVVTNEAQDKLKVSVDQLIKNLAQTFQQLIKLVKDHEQSHALANLTAEQGSITKGLKRLKEFNLFKWLCRFRDKHEQLSLLAKVPNWVPKLSFPKDIMGGLGQTSTRIADEIGMIIFFYGILDESEQAKLPEKLFAQMHNDMKKLEEFYKEQTKKLEDLAMQALKVKLCDASEKHFQEFLENTMSNSASFVTSLNSELMKAANDGRKDVQVLVSKLQSAQILSRDSLGVDEHTKLQAGFKSAIAIVKAFPDPSQVKIDVEFSKMCKKLLGQFSEQSAVCQQQANTNFQSFNGSALPTAAVHYFKKGWDDTAEAVQIQNAELKKQIKDYEAILTAVEDTDEYARVKRIDAIEHENTELRRQVALLEEDKHDLEKIRLDEKDSNNKKCCVLM